MMHGEHRWCHGGLVEGGCSRVSHSRCRIRIAVYTTIEIELAGIGWIRRPFPKLPRNARLRALKGTERTGKGFGGC